VIFKKLEISGGFEYYTVFSLMCDKECLSDLRLDLSSCSKVLEFSYFPVNPPLMGEMTLTPQEKRIVRVAYERGLFSVPRGVTLEELAREFGMTKNTLNYHIKNAVRKILRKYLSS